MFGILIYDSIQVDAEAEHDSITLEITSQGGIVLKNQVTNYITHGDALADYNIIQFFTNTYESKIWRTETDNNEDQDHIKRGHPKYKRVSYKPDHPKHPQYNALFEARVITIYQTSLELVFWIQMILRAPISIAHQCSCY